MQTLLSQLFHIKYPLVQAGMIWCSGWELASAVSNAGGLGLIGAGSMYPDVFEQHVKKCRQATPNPYGVNIPLLYPQTDELVEIVLKERVPIVFTSAGNPAKYTSILKAAGCKVVHVVANQKFAQKAQQAGVDAIVGEGFEAGGHNGKEETTTLVLIQQLTELMEIPVIAAGGIATGRAMFAALAMGAAGVQIGSRFVMSEESSAHPYFKERIAASIEGDTRLMLKKVVPVRLLTNAFAVEVNSREQRGASKEELLEFLGRGRAKLGMFEGNMDDGELEIGQVASMLHKVLPASEIIQILIEEFNQTSEQFSGFKL